MFLAFQYPVEIPGVSNINFLRTALNERNKYYGIDSIPTKDFENGGRKIRIGRVK